VRDLPRVTVIIPTFNRATLLPRAVESALAAGRDLEVIVVDDASEDETPRVCAGMQGIRYLRLDRNGGVAAARNAGVSESRAEFVTTLGDDDLRLPGSLDAQVRLLEESPHAAFCYGRVLVGDARRLLPTGEVLPALCPTGDIFWELLERNFVPDLSVVARKDKLFEVGLFDSGLSGGEDWDMWLRLAERWHAAAVGEPVALYRGADAASGQMCSDSVGMYRQLLRVQGTALGRPRARAVSRAERRRVRRRLLDLAYEAMVYEAEQALAEGDRGSARAKLREALRLRPLRASAGGCLLRLLAARRPSLEPAA
jgi:glycosyltransferase involved in cell wall biosynthesis